MELFRIEPTGKWIRGMIDGQVVIDSTEAKLGWEHQYYPWWYFPRADVDENLPATTADNLADHVKVDWNAVDQWFEEDEEVFIHPRSPFTRIDCLASSRHVVVSLDGTVLADSTRPTILFETGLPARYYLPLDDVRTELLQPTATSTGCPYKGFARYWSVAVDGELYEDLVWGYDEPFRESAPVKGLMCFYNEKVDLTIDGDPVSQPVTPFS